MSGRMNRVELRENVRAFFPQGHSLRASSRIWASETSLARTLARSHEARFACSNRGTCSQAMRDKVNCRYY